MSRLIPLMLLLAACGGPDMDAETTAEGACTYEDAEKTADGADQQAAAPESGSSFDIRLDVEGTGDLNVSDPQCSLDGNAFEALYEGTGEVSGDGVYVASFASADAAFETPSGCEIPDAEVQVVTGVSVVATLENTASQCTTYCEAKARSTAESECSGDADEASCRADVEGEYTASCETACTDPETVGIIARADLGAAALADLAVSELSGSALGSLSVDLTFDHLENADGDTVAEVEE